MDAKVRFPLGRASGAPDRTAWTPLGERGAVLLVFSISIDSLFWYNSMKRIPIFVSVLLMAGLVTAPVAQAQTQVKLGPRLGVPFGDVADGGGNLFFGGDVRFYTEALPVVPNVSTDFYLVDSVEGVDRSIFAVDVNALFEFGVDNAAFTPYSGAGVGITRFSAESTSEQISTASSNSEIGVNLVGGARFLLDPLEPFVQLNATIGSDLTRLGLTGGLLFTL